MTTSYITGNPGSGGPSFNTDLIGTVNTPISKMAWGLANTINVVNEMLPMPVKLPYGTHDTFGRVITAKCINEIDIQFYRDVPNNQVIFATTAGGGFANTFNGMMQMSTTTATTGEIKCVSIDNVTYRSGAEVYALFTGAWITGGTASCSQRIGLYDSNNGFYISYEGTTFGVSSRINGVDTQTSQANFNVDTLTAAANSYFTRAGTPESLNTATLNVFRIRYGWLGAAPIKFEVLAPDGHWVLFHVIRQPNLSSNPSIYNSDLPITAHLVKTAGATNVQFNTACWGAGTTHDDFNASMSGQLQTTTGSLLNFITQETGTMSFVINTSTTGSIIAEATTDGVNWFTHPQIYQIGSAGLGKTMVTGAFTPVSNATYILNTIAFRDIRLRVTSTLGAIVNVVYNSETIPYLLDVTGSQVSLQSQPTRNDVRFYATGVIPGAVSATETLLTMSKSANTWGVTSGTSFAVSPGKTLKLTSMTFASRGNTTATAHSVTFNLRANTLNGAVQVTTGPIIAQARTAIAATANAWDRLSVPLPVDGIEIPNVSSNSALGVQIGVTYNAVWTTNKPDSLDVLMTGYEY